MDSNHRPLPCQGSALDQLSYGPAGNDPFNSNGPPIITATFLRHRAAGSAGQRVFEPCQADRSISSFGIMFRNPVVGPSIRVLPGFRIPAHRNAKWPVCEKEAL